MKKDEIIAFLGRFKEDHQDKYHIRRIGIFGSAARGEATEKSDLDVVVDLSEPDLFHLIGIKQELEALLDCPVDIVRYRQAMNPFLRQRIDREAVYA